MTEIVSGIEGKEMTLTCNVYSGEPAETIFWITKEQVVLSGGPGRLNYTFIPQQEDNHHIYTCKANNSLNSVPLETNVQLRLTCEFNLNIFEMALNIQKVKKIITIHTNRIKGTSHPLQQKERQQ